MAVVENNPKNRVISYNGKDYDFNTLRENVFNDYERYARLFGYSNTKYEKDLKALNEIMDYIQKNGASVDPYLIMFNSNFGEEKGFFGKARNKSKHYKNPTWMIIKTLLKMNDVDSDKRTLTQGTLNSELLSELNRASLLKDSGNLRAQQQKIISNFVSKYRFPEEEYKIDPKFDLPGYLSQVEQLGVALASPDTADDELAFFDLSLVNPFVQSADSTLFEQYKKNMRATYDPSIISDEQLFDTWKKELLKLWLNYTNSLNGITTSSSATVSPTTTSSLTSPGTPQITTGLTSSKKYDSSGTLSGNLDSNGVYSALVREGSDFLYNGLIYKFGRDSNGYATITPQGSSVTSNYSPEAYTALLLKDLGFTLPEVVNTSSSTNLSSSSTGLSSSSGSSTSSSTLSSSTPSGSSNSTPSGSTTTNQPTNNSSRDNSGVVAKNHRGNNNRRSFNASDVLRYNKNYRKPGAKFNYKGNGYLVDNTGKHYSKHGKYKGAVEITDRDIESWMNSPASHKNGDKLLLLKNIKKFLDGGDTSSNESNSSSNDEYVIDYGNNGQYDDDEYGEGDEYGEVSGNPGFDWVGMFLMMAGNKKWAATLLLLNQGYRLYDTLDRLRNGRITRAQANAEFINQGIMTAVLGIPALRKLYTEIKLKGTTKAIGKLNEANANLLNDEYKKLSGEVEAAQKVIDDRIADIKSKLENTNLSKSNRKRLEASLKALTELNIKSNYIRNLNKAKKALEDYKKANGFSEYESEYNALNLQAQSAKLFLNEPYRGWLSYTLGAVGSQGALSVSDSEPTLGERFNMVAPYLGGLAGSGVRTLFKTPKLGFSINGIKEMFKNPKNIEIPLSVLNGGGAAGVALLPSLYPQYSSASSLLAPEFNYDPSKGMYGGYPDFQTMMDAYGAYVGENSYDPRFPYLSDRLDAMTTLGWGSNPPSLIGLGVRVLGGIGAENEGIPIGEGTFGGWKLAPDGVTKYPFVVMNNGEEVPITTELGDVTVTGRKQHWYDRLLKGLNRGINNIMNMLVAPALDNGSGVMSFQAPVGTTPHVVVNNGTPKLEGGTPLYISDIGNEFDIASSAPLLTGPIMKGGSLLWRGGKWALTHPVEAAELGALTYGGVKAVPKAVNWTTDKLILPLFENSDLEE